jgi:hypothetical protein
MKPLASVLRGAGRRLWDGGTQEEKVAGGDLTSVQCKPIQNCHNKYPLYNKYILTKMKKKVCL